MAPGSRISARLPGGSLVVRGGRVLLPGGAVRRCDLCISRGRIAAIGRAPAGAKALDASGCLVAPGFVDLHSHAIGHDDALTGSLELFAPAGTLARSLARHLRETGNLRAAPVVRGFRLESPYLAATGAGRAEDLAVIDRRTTERLLAAGGGAIRVWDISPELAGAPQEIRFLSARGIACSLAHTRATIAEARTAVDAGARLVTHLYDVFPLPRRREPGVQPAGLVDYLLVEDRLFCELVLDGTHADPLLAEKALRCKGADRLLLVTDSNLGSGLPPGRHRLRNWGVVEIRGPNDGVRLVERGMCLAGSALTPVDSFRNAVRILGLTVGRASVLCSRTPARLLGLNAGEIAVGRDADLVLLDGGLEVRATVVGGRIAWQG
jgi:N-acetylglucosamine-6-phosphate deacetylase